ncbi:hypothetical protein INT44_001554 [Umbelopsis vinacea]|uniref:C2H2-type domain-containing protein n=1 Tax=Umbelopsis vinacea TaxID=44442 RepID=A0A8H7UE94_9FUNG|nr:hypothetical protein INT44_001554 [Umbelopsis vinacea]KAI9283480.1 hypothetical protein BC943DRAFT_327725 [Umbelopsis sp. AD052]
MPKTSIRNKHRTDGSQTRSKQKLFQCTGFGDCKMVFTRSEHLARHARKHTGEKPFKCVVDGCPRMFSRFDNMMQHTQTHNHQRNKKNREKFTEEEDKPSRRNKQQQRRALPPPPLQTTMLTPPHSHQKLPSLVVGSWHSHPELPISPVSPTYNQWAHSMNSPPTSQHSPVSLVHSASPSSVQSPDEPLSPFQQGGDRRLSVAELCNPIEEHPIHSDSMFLPLDERISLTKDEYEALEGLTQFQRI